MLAGLAVAASGLLAALALVYANSTGLEAAADQAQTQQRAESALGVSASTRFALGQILLFVDAGGVDDTAFAILDDDARAGIDQLETRIGDLATHVGPADGDPVRQAMSVVSARVEEYLVAIEAGDVEEAAAVATGSLGPALDTLDGRLVDLRDRAAQALATARAESGRLGTAARFMVALGVPAIALIALAITARRRTRQIMLHTELEKERDLNRSKDQLIANLSHELRTPLTGIYSAALTIEDTGYADPDLAIELNEMIVDQSADLTRMVEDLLVSARADAGRLSIQLDSIRVSAEVESVASEFRRSTEITVKLRDAVVIADPTRLRQILRNLISNAVRHGGDEIAVLGRACERTYELAVVDDGPGVPPEIEPRLFTPFVHDGDRPLVTGSVGLGLSITKVLSEQMDGSIEYERRGGRSWFIVTIPRDLEANDDSPGLPSPASKQEPATT